MPRSRLGSLHCRIGVISSEGVAINLLHYVLIISVKLLQKLTVSVFPNLFSKGSIRTNAPRSNINGSWSYCYFELVIDPESSPVSAWSCVGLSLKKKQNISIAMPP